MIKLSSFQKLVNGPHLLLFLLVFLFATNSFQTNLQSQLISGLGLTAVLFVWIFKSKTFRLEPLDLIPLGFLLFFNLSFWDSQTPYGFKEFNTFNLGFLLYFCLKNTTSLSVFKSKSVSLIMSSALSISLFVFLMDFLISPVDRFAAFFQGDQAYSVYPNVFATFLLFIIPLNFALYYKTSFQINRTQKIIYLTSLILSLTSLWLTGSRGIFLSFIFLLGLAAAYLLVKHKSFKRLLFCLGTSLFLLIGTFFLSSAFNQAKVYNINFQDRINLNQDISAQKSLDERLVFFANSFQIGLNNLFLGTGPGSFEFINPSYQQESLVNSEHPHNIFLKLFAESGLISSLLFLAWSLSLFFIGFKNLLQNLDSSYFLIFATFFAVLTSSLVDYNLSFTLIWILFFTFAGFLANYKLRHLATTNSKNLKAPFLLIATFLFLFSTYQSAIFLKLNQNPNDQFALLAPFSFKNDFLNSSPLAPARFPNFAPALLSQSKTQLASSASTSLLNQYLALDPYNNFEAYYLAQKSSALDSSQITKLKNLLFKYNNLLAVNSHHTVATSNPYFAYLLYQDLIVEFPEEAVLQKEFEKFKIIFFSEMAKFDTRYQTNLIFTFFDAIK